MGEVKLSDALRSMDAEANAFAMELLMPFDWIMRDAAGIDIEDERRMGALAKKYRVNPLVMAARIAQVRFILDAGHRGLQEKGSGRG